MTLKDEILALLAVRPGLTDREITNALRGSIAEQQPVNIACRQMAEDGRVLRERNRPNDNFIGNYPTSEPLPEPRGKNKYTKDHGEGELAYPVRLGY